MYDKNRLKIRWASAISPLYTLFLRLHLTPTHITLCGAGLILMGCFSYSLAHPTLALMLFTLGGLCDAIDGAYARETGQVTPFGGFLDSVVDRYNEFLLVGCVLFVHRDNLQLYYFSFLLFSGLALMSYTRALYEKNGYRCPANPFEYLERGLLFLLFFMAGRPDLWLVLIAIGTHFFIALRIARFYRLTMTLTTKAS